MRKFVLASALTAIAFTATPAVAAPAWRVQPAVQREIQSDINQLDRQIDRAQQRRAISQREAMGLKRDAANLQRVYVSYQRGGLTRAEVSTLNSRVNAIHAKLRLEKRDWNDRRRR